MLTLRSICLVTQPSLTRAKRTWKLVPQLEVVCGTDVRPTKVDGRTVVLHCQLKLNHVAFVLAAIAAALRDCRLWPADVDWKCVDARSDVGWEEVR